MNAGTIGLLAALVLGAVAYIARWWSLERRRWRDTLEACRPRPTDALLGFVTNFLDTLGIGSFAPTTAYFKLRARMPDEEIPGTLNSGQALPTITQAFIFIATVSVDLTTLVGMVIAAVLGAWLGVGIVARLSRRAIQLGMGAALLCAALLYLASNLHWMPGGGEALQLTGARLIVAVAGQRRARRLDDAGHRAVRTLPHSGEFAGHESAGGLPHHDGLVWSSDAYRRLRDSFAAAVTIWAPPWGSPSGVYPVY